MTADAATVTAITNAKPASTARKTGDLRTDRAAALLGADVHESFTTAES
jgi:hypothetical protein